MKNRKSIATVYNPHELQKEDLIKSFVARREVFEKLFHEIKGSEMKHPEQHYLIEGQRGMGKTTLLLRLSYEIENDSKLDAWLVPLVFKEEAYYGITRLFKLWEAIARMLEDKEAAFAGLSGCMGAIYSEKTDYERRCFEILNNALEKHRKKIILFIDNLGEMFMNFDDMESRRLREVLMTCPHLRIIGASTIVLESFFHYKHAFYEFFKKVHLRGLNREESHSLLLELARIYGSEKNIRNIIENQPVRIDTLRILTGGVIRTIVLLFDIFQDAHKGDAIRDLEKVLDRVTPLYKHRMDDLTPPQREIVNCIALNWDAMAPEEIAHQVRMSIDDVSTILAGLEKVFIIQRVTANTQIHFYKLREPFFNIWYLMRLAPRGGQTKVLWLTRFFELWYTKDELVQRAKRQIEALRTADYYPKAAYYVTEALAATAKLDIRTEHELISTAREFLSTKDKSLVEDLSPSDKELFDRGGKFYEQEQFQDAISSFLKIKNKNEAIYFKLGYCYSQLSDDKKAEQYYLMAMEKGNAGAMNSLAWLYFEQKSKKEDALKYAKRAVEKDKNIFSTHTLACIYLWNNQPEQAVEITKEFLFDKESYEKFERDIILYLILLLAKKHYQYATAYFESPDLNLKERFKPVYYALLSLTNDKNELKMPLELAEPVGEIIEQIEQMAKDYA